MSTNVAERVAERLREVRKEAGFSIRQLARRSGMAPESISRSERGHTEISITSLARLCTALGIDLKTFFEFDRRPTSVSEGSPQMREAMAVFLNVPQARLRAVLRAIETLMQAREPTSRGPRTMKATRASHAVKHSGQSPGGPASK